jgi:thiol-disulfide isomerase/thioredoxin
MKLTFALMALCILTFSRSFCQAIILGNFKNFSSTDYRIVYNQSILNNYQGDLLANGKTSMTGDFSTSFDLPAEQPVILFIGNQFFKLWAIPNTSLEIKENDNGYVFSGKSSTENEFLYQSGIMQPYKISGEIIDKGFEPVKQTRYLDSIENKRSELYRSLTAGNTVSAKFNSFVTGEIRYFTFLNKNQYPQRFLYVDKSIKQEDIGVSYYAFWNDFTLLHDDNLSDTYSNSLRDFIEYLAKRKLGSSTNLEDIFNSQFQIMDSLLARHPITKQKQKAEAIRFLIQYTDLPTLTHKEINNFSALFPASPYSSFLEGEWKKKKANALTTPAFKLKNTRGAYVDIKDLKGKVVYIDFWGSWCKPCIAQMPNSEKLQQKFKEKDVAFLFIDFYDSKERWLKTIKDRKLKGIHIKAEKEDEEYFDNVFGVKQGFPRYALIDKSGVLITTSAPHPNDKEIISFIEQYLK